MNLILKLVYVTPTFLVIFIIQLLKDVKSLSMEDVVEMIIDFHLWTNAKQHVVSKKPHNYALPVRVKFL